jgi:hypothetical protein
MRPRLTATEPPFQLKMRALMCAYISAELAPASLDFRSESKRFLRAKKVENRKFRRSSRR